jgi:hypothetical protein
MASTIAAGTTSGTAIAIAGDTSGVLQLQTNGTTAAVTINTSQNVGIGTSSPTQRLHLNVGGATDLYTRYTNGSFTDGFFVGLSSGNIALLAVNDNLPMQFQTNGTSRLNIPAAGGVQAVTTISVGNATPAASGAGITFPASQSASSDANTLDDYEEGTFSPTIIGSSTAGTASYTTRVGRYTKIGNRVLFSIYLDYSAGNGTGNLQVTGLPFTSNSTSNNLSSLSVGLSNIGLPASSVCWAYVASNSTTIVMSSYPAGGGAAASVSYDAAGDILLAGHYEV